MKYLRRGFKRLRAGVDGNEMLYEQWRLAHHARNFCHGTVWRPLQQDLALGFAIAFEHAVDGASRMLDQRRL
jgi:hypothetical protein